MASWDWFGYNGVIISPILWLVDVHTGIVPSELLARLNTLVFSGELSGSIAFQVINVIAKFWHLDWRMGKHPRGLEGRKDFNLQYHKMSLNRPQGHSSCCNVYLCVCPIACNCWICPYGKSFCILWRNRLYQYLCVDSKHVFLIQ